MLKARFLVIHLTVLLSLQLSTSIAQTTLTWKDFDSITYVEKWDSTYQSLYLIPLFSKKLNELDGKEIIIIGYLFSFDILNDYYMLKSNEQKLSFGCDYSNTNTNTDEIIELNFKNLDSKYIGQFIDKKVTIKGILKLNDSDILSFPINIESAEIVK